MFEQLRQAQQHWHELPLGIMASVRQMGAVDYYRFSAPSNEICLRQYVKSRAISYQGHLHVVPMVELVNHSGELPGYSTEAGVAIKGSFEREVLVRYNFGDPWQMITAFGFADLPCFAHSLPFSMNFDGYRIEIGQNLFDSEVKGGVFYPRLVVDKDMVRLSFLNLGTRLAPRVPRSVFYRLMNKIPIQQPDELFDRIQHHNRMQFIILLRKMNSYNGNIISMLKEAAFNQLEALSACFGTRPLGDELVPSSAIDGS